MKRGTSGLSLVVGLNKPLGMSSHDVVNRVRQIFEENRVGHTGTLDPQASGALLLCVGPATRLNPYMQCHDKRYRFSTVFGIATETDDAEGAVLRTGAVPDEVADPFFARSFVENLVGKHRQIPPVYSAIKVKGKRAYKSAREGTIIELEPRDIEIMQAQLLGIDNDPTTGNLCWHIEVHVSKGTYIRSLARDIGNALGCPAHVGELCRTSVGSLALEDCMTFETLKEQKEHAALDPVKLLGYRHIYVRDRDAFAVKNGQSLSASAQVLFTCPQGVSEAMMCSCTTGTKESTEPLSHGEMLSVVADNKLIGLYRFDEETQTLKSRCVFALGVSRGRDS